MKMGINQIIYKIKLLWYKMIHRDPMNLYIDNYRNKGAIIGENVRAFSPITAAEPYLLTVGDNVTISHGVVFLTHDNSVIKSKEKIGTDLVGRVTIGRDCFIGCNTVLLPGIELAAGTIVGAGSIVTKSVTESGLVIAGNPARIIGKGDTFFQKYKKNAFDFQPDGRRMTFAQRKACILQNQDKLMKK